MKSRSSLVVPGATRTGGFNARFGRGGSTELKFFDTGAAWTFDSTAEVPANGGQTVLIPQGDTESSRDGRIATVKSIQVKGSMTWAPAAGAAASTNCFLYVILDKQCNGAAAGVTDVFTSSSLQAAFHNLANSDRFVILKKKRWNFTSQAGVTTAYGPVVKICDFYKRLDIPITYSSTTGALTEIKSNNIFLIAGCDASGDDLVSFAGSIRVRFVG